MLEKELEAKFKKRVEKRGAKVWKFVSPGKAGVPDRIVLIPGGHCVFAEIKRPGGNTRPLQTRVLKELHALSFDTRVIDSEEAIEFFCDSYLWKSGR